MKKLFSVFMILVLVLGLAACGSKNDGEGTSQGTAPESSVQTVGNESILPRICVVLTVP